MAGHEWEDWFEREEFIGQISDIRVQNLQVERELVQKRTFTRWMNLHLEKCDPPIEVQDLFLDIRDGHILMALLEELSGCQMLHRYKRSSHRIFRLNNIAKVLSFLEERNVKLVSIDAADVADGNSSIILGLIWNIILFFQIKELTGNIRSQFPSSSSLSSIPTSSDSDASCCSTPSGERQSVSTAMREHSKAIKKLLQWVQKRTRKYSVAVKDFGKSWTSGLAFLAVIKSIDPSLVDMRKALLRNAKDNLEDSFRIAHYSLGIPRLLEPEDVTINAPDEQSIMTYVSQFLEHFPGREEPEEPVPPIERSVSMGRLNLREKDSNHIRNSIQQSRVKERSHMFQRVCTQSPPRILISSVSEDRSAMSPPFRPAAARSWSSEDILADSPHMEEISSSVAEKPQESASDVSTNSTSKSPELSYAHSPTGSSLPESVTSESMIGDSAISSPDSWVESELGGMQERLCESDSSLCDSGTAWDVYRATPVEVTNLDEGCVLSMEERAPEEESIPESYVDEGICSLGSLENPVQKSQGDFEKKQPEVVEEKEEVHLEKYNQDMPVEKVPDHSKAEIAEEEPSEQTIQDTSQSREPEPSVGLCNAVELTSSAVEKLHESDHSNQSQPKKNNVGDRAVDLIEGARDHEGQIAGQSVGLNESGNSEELQGETECQERQENTMIEDVGETREEASEEVLREDLNAQENFSSETLANTDPTSQDRAPETSLDPSAGRNVPLISISSEPEEQNLEGICDPERQHPARQDEVQPEGTDPDVDCPPNPHENNLDFNYNVDIPLCPVTESDQPKASEQTRDRESQHLDEHGTSQNIGESDTGDKMTMSECELTCQTSSSEATPVNAEQEMDSTDQPDGHKDTAATEQNTPDSVNSKPSGTFEPGCLHRDTDLFYTDFDQSPGPEDVVGAPVEPMDLFYPDKEESMFLEPPDAETQSWPSVLSVSALKPAPASETQADQPLSLLGEDFSHGADWTQENDELIPKTNQDTDAASKPQELCVLPGETTGGLWGDDAPADGSDLRTSGRARENTEPVSEGSIRQDESQIPPVLRHRKGARSTESTGDRPAVTAASSGDDNGDSDSGCSDSWELYVLLLLWLLLYCFWLLPQMDLKTLPSLLLNLEP